MYPWFPDVHSPNFPARWSAQDREELNFAWHRLNGPFGPFCLFARGTYRLETAWPDATEALYALKKYKIIAVLLNGNLRLLVDMVSILPSGETCRFSLGCRIFQWDVWIIHGVAKYLSLSPSKCAMVAAHTFDLRGAAGCGYKTVYICIISPGAPNHPLRILSFLYVEIYFSGSNHYTSAGIVVRIINFHNSIIRSCPISSKT